MHRPATILLFWVVPIAALAAGVGPFLAKPYLQLGEANDPSALTVMWQAEPAAGDWKVEWKSSSTRPMARMVRLGSNPHAVYRAILDKLKPGETFTYRVLLDGKRVFEAEARARGAASAPYKFAVFGDCGADTAGQRQIAVEAFQFKPDFVFIPGDIVYTYGEAHDYHQKFFPIYNADQADKKSGAPLMRSTVFTAAAGNHDVAGRDLGIRPDGLAYFYYWSQPLNGLSTFVRPGFKASSDQAAALREASGAAFPRMSNFSFDYGDSHWLVLDSNPDIDWSQPDLAQWVEGELASPAAMDAQWRFVGFHHPGFNSSWAHAGDQQMRVLAKAFEDGKVDVVFSGHVHNYQRTHPMRFKLESYDASKSHRAPGKWTLDQEFDGKTRTKPSGVVYVISGAGGAGLYDQEQGRDRKSWQEFTAQFVSDVHSFTAVEMNRNKASFRQIDDQGRVVDSFAITK